jgi:hypothetical protein
VALLLRATGITRVRPLEGALTPGSHTISLLLQKPRQETPFSLKEGISQPLTPAQNNLADQNTDELIKPEKMIHLHGSVCAYLIVG